MRQIRVVLMLLLFPFCSTLGQNLSVVWSNIDAAWSDYQLSTADQVFRVATANLEDLHKAAGTPSPRDWRDTVIQPTQTFAQYALSNPITPTVTRHIIYVQPVGRFSKAQQSIVEASAEFLGLYFACDVTLLDPVDDNVIAGEARRLHPDTKQEQLLASWIQNEFLAPRLPNDAIALIALTATDLWPDKNWNFVFGQAPLKDRVGVWLMARFGNPDDGPAEFTQCLRRTLKTASHETGHMYSMQHCVHFECNMAGSGSLEEADRGPLYLCPECLTKRHWAIRPDTNERLTRLADFCDRLGLGEDFEYCKVAAQTMASPLPH
ncbi:MAG: archaemetzincin [Fuerstiella sp.]